MKLRCWSFAVVGWLALGVAAQQWSLAQGGPSSANGPQANAPQANAAQAIQPGVWPPAAEPAKPQPAAGEGAPAAPHQAEPHPEASQPGPAARVPSQAAPAGDPGASGEIELDTVVTDKGGHPESGLTQPDFTVLDNGRAVTIDSFRAYGAGGKTPNVEIVLVVDTVNIGFQEVSYSRFGIEQFLRSHGGHLPAPTSVFWYTDSGMMGGEPPTTDGNAIAARLDATEGRLRSINRSAGAWGAIERFQMSLETLDRVVQAAGTDPSRKLLIWIGPGWPILDNPNIQVTWKEQQNLFHNVVGFSTRLREGHMAMYSVAPGTPDSYTFLYQGFTKGVKKASQVSLPNLDLKVLAVESGGQVLTPSNDLAGQIEACARDATAYYALKFTPPRADGPDEYHEIKVKVDKPGLTARTNTGYYNEPAR